MLARLWPLLLQVCKLRAYHHYMLTFYLSLCLLLETQQQADEIALAVKVTYESQGKPLITIADAIEAKSFFKHPGAKVLQVGDAKGKEGSIVYVLCPTWFILYLSDAIAKSAHQVKGTISCDSQYHFHMETQVQFNLYITIHWTCCPSYPMHDCRLHL